MNSAFESCFDNWVPCVQKEKAIQFTLFYLQRNPEAINKEAIYQEYLRIKDTIPSNLMMMIDHVVWSSKSYAIVDLQYLLKQSAVQCKFWKLFENHTLRLVVKEITYDLIRHDRRKYKNLVSQIDNQEIKIEQDQILQVNHIMHQDSYNGIKIISPWNNNMIKQPVVIIPISRRNTVTLTDALHAILIQMTLSIGDVEAETFKINPVNNSEYYENLNSIQINEPVMELYEYDIVNQFYALYNYYMTAIEASQYVGLQQKTLVLFNKIKLNYFTIMINRVIWSQQNTSAMFMKNTMKYNYQINGMLTHPYNIRNLFKVKTFKELRKETNLHKDIARANILQFINQHLKIYAILNTTINTEGFKYNTYQEMKVYSIFHVHLLPSCYTKIMVSEDEKRIINPPRVKACTCHAHQEYSGTNWFDSPAPLAHIAEAKNPLKQLTTPLQRRSSF